MLTDYVLAGMAWALARALVRANDSRAAALWALAFAATGVGAFVGGSVHGFGSLLPRGLEHVLRVGAVMSVGVVGTSLLAGAIFAGVRPGGWRRTLLGLCVLKLAVYLPWVALHPEFRYAAYDAIPAGLVVLGFLARWAVQGRTAARLGVLAMLLSIAGAVAQQTRLGIHPVWFNHNDLYHVVQAGALWLLQRAGLHLRDATSGAIRPSSTSRCLR
jgi:hypothetical protein